MLTTASKTWGFVRRRILALGLLATCLPGASLAQDPNKWVGKRVITKFGAVLQVDGRVIDNQKLEDSPNKGQRRILRIYRVEQSNGPWLWLQDEESSIAGWVTARWLIDYHQAIEYFTNQIRANPDSANAYMSRGNIWEGRKEYDIALADFNEAIRLEPGNEMAWACRGSVWNAKKEYDKAIADYSEAIRLDPRYALAYFNRGLTLAAKEAHDKAIDEYDRAILLDPKLATAQFSRGNSYRVKHQYDQAIDDYNRAIRLDSRYAAAYINRGATWYAKKEIDKAIEDFTTGIRLDPKDAVAYNNRGWAYISKKNYDQVTDDYDQAIRLDPKNTDHYFNRSVARMILRRGDAVSGFKTVLDLEEGKGDRSTYAVILGHLAAWQAGNDAEARRFLDQAPQLDTTAWPFPAVKFLRGELDEGGLLAQAVDDGKRTEARCYLGLDRLLKGRMDEALAHFRWVRDHGTASYTEYTIALAELDRLGEPR